MLDLTAVEGFEWDSGNARKNEKHGVTPREAEQVFLNQPLLLLTDERHSGSEPRFHALGHTEAGRMLHLTFTLREAGRLIRVISARVMHKKEGSFMAKPLKPIPKFRSAAQERKFWETHDSTAYLDWSKPISARFPNLKRSTKSISLRLPLDLLEQIKVEANRRDVPYQSLIKV